MSNSFEQLLHKPRFYAPVYFQRDTWGWKRKCEDFLAIKPPTVSRRTHEDRN